ncbi:FAD-dependent oxidoreductase [Mesorhizobium sp. M0522]|uniref:NAD(P)/FAD-dependent oxidoreductase n=1 Tax=Mesorhizobium sp. M0522 TaxID=2956958 RepID=UPI0033370A93
MKRSLPTTIKSTPYWWDDCDFPQLSQRPLEKICDVAIVGGGYTGLSAAFELARAGKHVQLFDRQMIGRAASSRNGGMASGSIRPGRNELIKRFGIDRANGILAEGHAARQDLWRFIEAENVDCDGTRTGAFEGAMSAEENEGLRRHADFLRETLGIETYWVARSDVCEYIGTDLYRGGMVRMDIHGLQPAKLLAGMLRIAASSGAVLHENTAVLNFANDAAGIRVSTQKGEIQAKKLIVCTDGYTDGFDPWLRRRLVPVRSRIIATEPLPKEVMDRLMPKRMMYDDTRKLSYYYRPTPDGSRILFGGRDGTTEGDPLVPTVHLRTELARVFPELANIGITHSWYGYVAMHRDMIPRIFSRDNVIYATGYCGSGIVWARWLGKKAAMKVLGHDEQVRSAFDFDHAPKAVPLYWGRPWFIPIVYSLYARHDRKILKRRADK